MTINGATYNDAEILYENDSYRVYCAIGGLPVAVGKEIQLMDGYVLINKLTGQQDAEYRAYAHAVASAHDLDALLGRVHHVESGIQVPKPVIQN